MLLKEKSKRLLKDKNLLKHSNPGQVIKRMKKHGRDAFEDLTFLCEHLEEKHLDDIFTEKELGRLIRIILKPRSKRTIMITEALAYQVWQKLGVELPPDIVNNLSLDISKTWVYAKLLSEYADKPLMRQ